MDDVQKVLKKIEFDRKKMGLSDELSLKKHKLNHSLKVAKETNKIVTRTNSV